MPLLGSNGGRDGSMTMSLAWVVPYKDCMKCETAGFMLQHATPATRQEVKAAVSDTPAVAFTLGGDATKASYDEPSPKGWLRVSFLS